MTSGRCPIRVKNLEFKFTNFHGTQILQNWDFILVLYDSSANFTWKNYIFNINKDNSKLTIVSLSVCLFSLHISTVSNIYFLCTKFVNLGAHVLESDEYLQIRHTSL